jgi:hypothetical protein
MNTFPPEDSLTPDQEERLALYLTGRMPRAERLLFESEALASDALSQELYRDRLFSSLPLEETRFSISDAAAAVLTRLSRFPRRWRLSLPVAAGAVVLLFLALHHGAEGPGMLSLRGGQALPRLISPIGDQPRLPDRFTWARLPSAAGYRFQLYGASMGPMVEWITPDTCVSRAALGPPADTLRSGYWRVIPRDSSGVEHAASLFVTFRVRS